MSRVNTYWEKKRDLNDWLDSIDHEELAEWGSKKRRDLMINYNRKMNGPKRNRVHSGG